MANAAEIRDFRDYLVNDRHQKRVTMQREDERFWEDTYAMPLVKKPEYQLRTGFVAEMLNGITQQIIGDTPKLYAYPKKDTKAAEAAARRVASCGNKWLRTLLRHQFSPFRETFKKTNILGEAWIYTPHNELIAKYDGDWQQDYPDALPVQFILYDPLVVFADPNEEFDGEPKRIVIYYERLVNDIRAHYPEWKGKRQYDDRDKVPFLFYIDKYQMYAEADEFTLFDRANPYNCVPFTHAYSGFGRETFDKVPEQLAMSRIRMVRDGIIEESTIRSDIYFNVHRYAHKFKTLYIPAGSELSKDAFDAYEENPDGINVVQLPNGADPSWFKVDETQLFDAQVYGYADRVMARQSMLYPLPLRGAASGTSGRQEDLLSAAGLAIYNCVLESNNLLWARAIDKAFRICRKIPGLLPSPVQESDLDACSELVVDLKRDDLVERDRKIGNGRISVNAGQRSLKTHLIQDYGMTQEEADNEIDEILAERIMFQSPDIAAFLGFKAAQKSGMADELQQYEEATQGKVQVDVGNPIGSRGGQPRSGNIRSETGMEMADVGNSAYGVRAPAGVQK